MQTHPLRLLVLSAVVLSGFLSPARASCESQRKTLAVLRFDNNTGDPQYDNLGRGLSSMMISDLSVVKELQLVERDRLEAVQNELDFQQTAYVDSTTAQTLGQLVGAEYIVVGAFITASPKMRLDTRVIRVATAEVVKTAEVTGARDKLFELQQRLADELIDGLALALSPEEQERLRLQQEANRLNDVETAVAYSNALALYDRGDMVGAMEEMNKVRKGAPASRLVGVAADEMEKSARQKAKDKAKDKANEKAKRMLGGIGKKP